MWRISVGNKTGITSGPDPIEAATRYVESLYRGKSDFGVGLLIKAELFNGTVEDAIYIRSDVILANAGRYAEAEQMLGLYLKNKPWPTNNY